jgi:DNA-directed RNA polymerase specialized sigma24 family protein
MAGRLEFGSWYREHHPDVVALLATVAGDVDVARSAAADAFVDAYRRRDRIPDMEAPLRWLYTLALRAGRRRSDRRAWGRTLRRVLGRPVPPPVDPPVLTPARWTAVRALPLSQRTALALRYVLDLPETEVAQVMGVTRAEASATLLTARRALLSLLPPKAAAGRPEPEPLLVADLAPEAEAEVAVDG